MKLDIAAREHALLRAQYLFWHFKCQAHYLKIHFHGELSRSDSYIQIPWLAGIVGVFFSASENGVDFSEEKY